MNRTDQDKALASLRTSLIPSSTMLDGRTEQDRLKFLVDFATVINYYDQSNKVFGNWKPVLLKDPVFLLAYISKTDFEAYYKRYDSEKAGLDISTSISFIDLQLEVYKRIAEWTNYLQKTPKEFTLKTFILNQVSKQLSQHVWSIIMLRSQLIIHAKHLEISKELKISTEEFNGNYWNENKGNPYWETLDLCAIFKENSPSQICASLIKAGDKLFAFFRKVILSSVQEFSVVKNQKSQFPDTLLLRTFLRLISIHQDQLNALVSKHMSFYNFDILNQKLLGAIPDQGYVFITLTSKKALYNLPKGTLFNGGENGKNGEILYSSEQDTELNPGQIKSAFTLLKNGDETNQLFLSELKDVDKVTQLEKGEILSWPTFGAVGGTPSNQVELGFIVSSPLFYLMEGERSVCLTIDFLEEADFTFMESASFLLSTSTEWFKVKNYTTSGSGSKLKVRLDLSPADPKIENFIKKPDGLISDWPLLKIEMDSFYQLNSPPTISSIKIEVKCSGLSNLLTYNDHGKVSTKSPFQVMGPQVLKDSSFFIGSKELFSKPINRMSFQFKWIDLPDDFENYYDIYNQYLAEKEDMTPVLPVLTWWQKLVLCIRRLFHKVQPIIQKGQPVFTNNSFQVKFKILKNRSWLDLNLYNSAPPTLNEDDPKSSFAPVKIPLISACQNLFDYDKKNNTLIPSTEFEYVLPVNDPSGFFHYPQLQNEKLTFTSNTLNGFVRMVLSNPKYGFGSSIFPDIVSYVALKNAETISKSISKCKTVPAVIPSPKVPYAPKAGSVTAAYQASQNYHFSSHKGNCPIQIFYSTALSIYKVYDSEMINIEKDQNTKPILSRENTQIEPLMLYPPFDNCGALYLELEGLLAPCVLSLYFELDRQKLSGNNSVNPEIQYRYLSQKGWKKLTVLSDETESFVCSGIIKIEIPADISLSHKEIKSNGFWISIGLQNEPANYCKTILVTTNGVKIKREVVSDISNGAKPNLKSNKIKATHLPIPQISTINQPFSTFGGKEKETNSKMNERISTRIKTKDRVVTKQDYFRTISTNFPCVFYSSSEMLTESNLLEIYTIQKYLSWKDAGAFEPILTRCKELEIENYLNSRCSAFVNLRVTNFNFVPITISVHLGVLPNNKFDAVHDLVMHQLNIYLSPWIKSDFPQRKIGHEIILSKVGQVIKNIPGVSTLKKLSISGNQYPPYSRSSMIYVSSMKHQITKIDV